MLAIIAAQGQHLSPRALAASLMMAVAFASMAGASTEAGKPSARDRRSTISNTRRDFTTSVFPVLGEQGFGACFLYDSTGLLLTDARIGYGADAPRVWIPPDRNVAARVLARNTKLGIAVLCVNPAQLSGCVPVPFADAGPGPIVTFEGDDIAAFDVKLGNRLTVVQGVVRRAQPDRIRAAFASRPASPGSPVVNSGAQVIAIATSRNDGSMSEAVPIVEALPLLWAAADSLRLRGYPKPELLPSVPLQSCAPAALKARGQRLPARLNDYMLEIPGYLVSFLTPPVCAYFEERGPPSSNGWFLWGALGGRYPPLVAVHVQPNKSKPLILWPVAMVSKVGSGTAHAVGTVVGAVLGGSEQRRQRWQERSTRCVLLRNGVVVEPLMRQRSGHDLEKNSFFVVRKGSRAAFFYYSREAFSRVDGQVPRIELLLFEPSKPDKPARLEVVRKTLELVAADLDPTREGDATAPAFSVTPPNDAAVAPMPPKGEAKLLVELARGSVIRAASVQAWGIDQVKIVLASGETVFVATTDVRAIRGKDGANWTRHVLVERGRVP